MLKYGLLISLAIYLISCTSSDNTTLYPAEGGKLVKTSLGNAKVKAAKVKAFSAFLDELSQSQMVHAAETDLHHSVKAYLPDSTISEGFDLHIREIGRIDTFRLVFHEYFDLYDDWSKTYLDIFSPSGELLQCKRMKELSFEGSTNINFINGAVIEIAYHDFFKVEDLQANARFAPLDQSTTTKSVVEGTIYEYYKIGNHGFLNQLSQKTQVSKGRDFPQSSSKLLSQAELKQYSIQEIKQMKEEILAEYGHIFSDAPTQSYYEMQPWYTPKSRQVDSLLTDIEKLNFECLKKIQQEY